MFVSDSLADGGDTEGPAARFLRSAQVCRIRDLEQLCVLSELTRQLSEFIHALQKERGASAIYLGSNGTQFLDLLMARIADCDAIEGVVRARLENLDERLDRMSSGGRFYARVALAFRELEALPTLRREIAALAIAPQDSIKAFSDLIGALLAISFEVGDIAADLEVARALLAFVNLAQAKEYAGQERATTGAAISSGRFLATDHQRLQDLVRAQGQALGIFAQFAGQTLKGYLQETLESRASIEVQRMRTLTQGGDAPDAAVLSADAWYRHATCRIDALQMIESQMTDELHRLCAIKLEQARSAGVAIPEHEAAMPAITAAMLFADTDGAHAQLGLEGGVEFCALNPKLPRPIRSILYVIQAQARRIDVVKAQLQSARAALTERKAIDRAKGILMSTRRLSEQQAYALLRETAMNQNKRIFAIAETIVSMAEILKV
jgi:AmiR/NasT family two-component response regulator